MWYDRFASTRGADPLLALRWMWYRAAGPYVRGWWHRCWNFRHTSGPLFIGRGTDIWFPEKVRFGKWVFLGRYGLFNGLCRDGVTIGDRVTLAEGFWIQGTAHLSNPGASLVIEEHVYIGPRAVLGFHGPVKIGAHTAIGANFQIAAQSHDLDAKDDIATATVPSRGISIGRHCWIGNDVKILDGVEIGDHVVIGAGSVVTKSIPARSVAYGVPCKVVRMHA
jgi:acetyltransferase-like isoleucine patch superfamily enzyme